VVATKGRPDCPNCLGKEGKTEWERVTVELENMGILSTADRGALVAYCEAWEEFVDLLAKVRKEGPVVYTDKGNAIQNPVLGAKNKASERLLKTAAQFGMTPAARTKIEATEGDGEDSFAKFAGLKVLK
jgi:P27 family predicted phage terminase small subunit